VILSEQQTLVRDTARSFSTEKLAPFAAERERSGVFPKDAMAEAASLGFCGMLVPEEWGGAALDHVSYAAALEEIAVGDGGLAGALSVQNSVVCMPLVHFGTNDQKTRWLKPLARGEMMGGFCLTEPQAGSDASALKTRARREGNGYLLSGTKQFVTMGATAGMVIVFAVTDPDAGKRGISAFLVPKDAKGVEVARVEDKMGQRNIACRAKACWARKVKVTRSRWPIWRAGASASLRRRWVSRALRSRPRAAMPRSARRSAKGLPICRPSRSSWPTWRRRSRPRA
jgi:butyryl-CoA dehydrogenase